MFKILTAKVKSLTLVLLFQVIAFTNIVAQIKVINVEKTVITKYQIGEKTNITIRANKADINFIPTLNNTVTIKAVLSSKNSNKQAAERDLSMQKMNVSQKGNSISIVNYVEIDANATKPSSSLKVTYTIEIPNNGDFTIKVKNDFGKLNSTNISANFDIESKFCSTKILNHKGKIQLDDNFGTVELKDIKGELDLKTSRTEMSLTNQAGDLIIRSSFSKLSLSNIQPTNSTKINDKHSEITLSQRCFNCYQYLFDLEKCKFNFPQGSSINYTIKEETKVEGSLHPQKSAKTIHLISVSGIISIK